MISKNSGLLECKNQLKGSKAEKEMTKSPRIPGDRNSVHWQTQFRIISKSYIIPLNGLTGFLRSSYKAVTEPLTLWRRTVGALSLLERLAVHQRYRSRRHLDCRSQRRSGKHIPHPSARQPGLSMTSTPAGPAHGTLNRPHDSLVGTEKNQNTVNVWNIMKIV